MFMGQSMQRGRLIMRTTEEDRCVSMVIPYFIWVIGLLMLGLKSCFVSPARVVVHISLSVVVEYSE